MVLRSFRDLRDLRGLRPIGAYAPEGKQISARFERKFIHKILMATAAIGAGAGAASG